MSPFSEPLSGLLSEPFSRFRLVVLLQLQTVILVGVESHGFLISTHGFFLKLNGNFRFIFVLLNKTVILL